MIHFDSEDTYLFLGSKNAGKEGKFKMYSFLHLESKETFTFLGSVADIKEPEGEMPKVKIRLDFSKKNVVEGQNTRTYYSAFLLEIKKA